LKRLVPETRHPFASVALTASRACGSASL
jgi:hypothetical protein